MNANPQLAVRHAALSTVEQLEQRCLLTAVLDRGVWIIRGDASPGANDQISVDLTADGEHLQATINGQAFQVAAADVRRIAVNARGGNDAVTLNLTAGLKIGISVFGGPGDDTITGSALNEYLVGGDGDDSIFGGEGRDSLYGCWGNDALDGGAGDDIIVAGKGNDLVVGGAGDDRMFGQTGSDSIAAGLGHDRIDGGAHSDQIHGGYGADLVNGGDGNDTLWGGDGRDSLIGGPGEDLVNYYKAEDRIRYSAYDTLQEEQRINPLHQVDDADELKSWLIDRAVTQWKWAFGQPVYYHWWWRGGFDGKGVFMLDTNAVDAPTASPENDHSETNVQEQGVDEADLVKTDGNYLYLLSGNELVILDAWPASEIKIISHIPIEGYAQGIYLNGDQVAVLSQTYDDSGRQWADSPSLVAEKAFCPIPWRWTTRAKLTLVDVTNRSDPKVVEETKLDGDISQSRVIDGRLYLVTNNPLDMVEPLRLPADEGDPKVAGDVQKWVYESEASYRARLEGMSLGELLPGYVTTTTAPDGTKTETSGPLAKLPEMYVPADPDEYAWNMFSVALFDMNDNVPGPVDTTSVVGLSGTIYASTDSLYVTATDWEVPMGIWQGEMRTDIYKFALGKTSVPLQATGEVPGWTVNQFAMDEEKDYFRIATTSSNRDGTANNVFVMAQSDQDLKITGGLTGLAFSERIYSARFVGNRGYLVTFRQVDPLFTLDMSDPKAPAVKGQLKIPGYSSYLHPIAHDLLIGIGRDADLNGRVKGVKASLFDVKDIENPKLLGDYLFPSDSSWNGSTWSAAEWDHHAFSYFPEYQILALPCVSYSSWWTNSGGLEVLKIDPTAPPDDVFTKLGRVEHDGQPQRSLRIGQFLYSIGTDAVKVVYLEHPGQKVIEVPLPNDTSDGPIYIL